MLLRCLLVLMIFLSSPLSAWAEGFTDQDQLLKAAKQAVNEKDAKKFISLFAPGTINERAEEILTESVKPLLDAGVGDASFAIVQGAERRKEGKIGFLDLRYKTNPNMMISYVFGKFGGKYYLMMDEYMVKRSKEPRPVIVSKTPPPIAEPAAPARSTKLTHRIYLKNGQQVNSAIAERDAGGLWAETDPGVRVYFSNVEILKVIELDKAVMVTQTIATNNPAPAKRSALAPVSDAVPDTTDRKQFVREFIEKLDHNGWVLGSSDAHLFGDNTIFMNMVASDLLKLADAGGIKEWLKFEEKNGVVTADLLFNLMDQTSSKASQRAALITFSLEEKKGALRVNSCSVNPYLADIKPSWPNGKPEGDDLLAAVKNAIEDHDAKKFMALYLTDGVDQTMLDSLKPIAQSIVTGTVTSATLEPAEVDANKAMEHDGFRYLPNAPIIGRIKFILKEYPGQSMEAPFGKKDGKYYLVTAIKEKI